jgi:hypothetical protein
MKFLLKFFTLLLLIVLISSCVTIIRGVKPKKSISISGFPENARVTVNGNFIGNTPVDYQINKRETQYVVISKDGFIPQIVKIETKLNPALTLASVYFGSIGFFIPTIIDLTKGTLKIIKTSNISYKLRQNKNETLIRNLTLDKQSKNSTFENYELYNELRKRPERKEYLFRFNCDSCLLALKMYKYSFDNGLSFSSEVFDPLKTYINWCYESNKITNQSYKCESLNPLFSKLSKVTDQNWNFSNQNLFIFQFNTKNIFSDFSKAIREQVAPDCEKCSKELNSFMKLVSKGYGEIEFNSNITLQSCIAQRKNSCSNSYFKKVNSIQDKVNFPLKVDAKRIQKTYNIVQDVGHLQVLKENNYYGFINNGVLILPPSFISLKIIRINSNSFVYAENLQKQILFSHYGDILIEKNKGNILIDEGNNFITSKSDNQWQLFLSDQLKLSSDKYDKIEFSNGGDLIFAWNNNQFSLINKKGIHVNNAKYDNFIKDRVIPNKDLVILEKNNKQGLVNSKGVEVVPFIYDNIGFNYNEKKLNDLIKGRIKVEKNGKIGFINESGKELVPIKYDEIEGFGASTKKISDKLVIVKDNGKVGLIDFEDGQIVIPVLYNEIFDFKALSDNSYKIAKVNKNGKFGYVNMVGEEIISPIYDEIKDFNNGYASFRVNNKWGLINTYGRETISPNYEEPLSFNGNETYASLNGSKVKIDRFGNQKYDTPNSETKQQPVPSLQEKENNDVLIRMALALSLLKAITGTSENNENSNTKFSGSSNYSSSSISSKNKCSYCNGTGDCRSCSRTFQVRFYDFRTKQIKTQNETRKGYKVCSSCQGSGVIYKTEAGNWDVKDKCHVGICNSGWIPCNDCNHITTKDYIGKCGFCKGTGQKN